LKIVSYMNEVMIPEEWRISLFIEVDYVVTTPFDAFALVINLLYFVDYLYKDFVKIL